MKSKTISQRIVVSTHRLALQKEVDPAPTLMIILATSTPPVALKAKNKFDASIFEWNTIFMIVKDPKNRKDVQGCSILIE